jgi:hypothetical protein
LFVFLPPSSFYPSIFFTFGFFLAVSFPGCFNQCSGDCARESALEDVVVGVLLELRDLVDQELFEKCFTDGSERFFFVVLEAC